MREGRLLLLPTGPRPSRPPLRALPPRRFHRHTSAGGAEPGKGSSSRPRGLWRRRGARRYRVPRRRAGPSLAEAGRAGPGRRGGRPRVGLPAWRAPLPWRRQQSRGGKGGGEPSPARRAQPHPRPAPAEPFLPTPRAGPCEPPAATSRRPRCEGGGGRLHPHPRRLAAVEPYHPARGLALPPSPPQRPVAVKLPAAARPLAGDESPGGTAGRGRPAG